MFVSLTISEKPGFAAGRILFYGRVYDMETAVTDLRVDSSTARERGESVQGKPVRAYEEK